MGKMLSVTLKERSSADYVSEGTGELVREQWFNFFGGRRQRKAARKIVRRAAKQLRKLEG